MRILRFDSVQKIADLLAKGEVLHGLSLGELVQKYELETLEISHELDKDALRGIKLKGLERSYSELSELVRKAVGEIDVALAKDARFWVSLVFSDLGILATLPNFEGTEESKRGEQRIKWLRTHWFPSTHRNFLRDHAIAQYWWTYELLSRQQDMPVSEALKLFDNQQDFRTQLVDRTAINGNSRVIGKTLQIVSSDINNYNRNKVRSYFSELNFQLGRRELEILPDEVLVKALQELWDLAK